MIYGAKWYRFLLYPAPLDRELSEGLVQRPPGPGPGPINLPAAIEDVMASLTVHTMSYLLLDQQAGQQIRTVAEAQLVKTTQNLSKLHDEAAARKQASSEQKS